MKFTLDTAGDDLTARAYLAAVIGPSRRPFGRPTQVQVPAGSFALLADNASGGRVLSVTVSATVAGQAFQFSQTNGGPAYGAIVGNAPNQDKHFVLMPGEQLYASATVAGPVSVFTNPF